MTRPMPKSGTPDAKAALRIMEWVYEHPEAAQVDPSGVEAYRIFCDGNLLETEDLWRQAFDMALVVWEKGYAAYQAKLQAETARILGG